MILIILLIFGAIISSGPTYAISPVDYCATKPTESCELLNSNLNFVAGASDQNGVPRKTAIVHKKFCQNGIFKTATMHVDFVWVDSSFTPEISAVGQNIYCRARVPGGVPALTGYPTALCDNSPISLNVGNLPRIQHQWISRFEQGCY